MGYKTILTVISTEGQQGQLDAAIDMARREDAHLDVFCLGVDHSQTGYYYAGASAYVFQESIDKAMAAASPMASAMGGVPASKRKGGALKLLSSKLTERIISPPVCQGGIFSSNS